MWPYLCGCAWVGLLFAVVLIPLYIHDEIVIRKGFERMSGNCTIVTWSETQVAVATANLPCLGQYQFKLYFSYSEVGWIAPGSDVGCSVWYTCRKGIYKAINQESVPKFLQHQKVSYRWAVTSIVLLLLFPLLLLGIICLQVRSASDDYRQLAPGQ